MLRSTVPVEAPDFEETAEDIGGDSRCRCCKPVVLALLVLVQEPYARKRQMNQKPYKVQDISKNIASLSAAQRSHSHSA